jgi:hypothetical protein
LCLALVAGGLLVGGVALVHFCAGDSSTQAEASSGPAQVPPDEGPALVQRDAPPVPGEGPALVQRDAPPAPGAPSGQDVRTKPLDSREQWEAQIRKKLPFESLTERLPKGKPVTPVKPLDAESKKRWETLDRDLAAGQMWRAKLLKALHEKTLKSFVESPGAGPGRFGLRIPTPEEILLDTNTSFFDTSLSSFAEPPPHGEPADFPASPGEHLSRVEPDDEFHFYHGIGLTDFLHPSGLGYIKDRDHVAGFKPHGFRGSYNNWLLYNNFASKNKIKRWRIHHVQLVGILSQDQPVVYLTDKLPSMEQVRQGKTRALDFFEEAALPSLRAGEDLYIVSKDDTIRMLGAVRATKTCQQCHDAEVGDLLGAFSYTLRPAPK